VQELLDRHLAHASSYEDQRKALAMQSMSQSAKLIFELLPLLLHYNHPNLPGYIDEQVPHGVSLFTGSARHQVMLQQYFGCTLPQPDESPIWGLYSMGSTASMAQSLDSDLDIWVCHSADLPQDLLDLLQQKCALISEWAAQRNVELSLFLVADNQFKSGVISQLSADNCGSAQHLLLLDEFYRSAMRIAGKHLVWYAVPAELPESYQSYVARHTESGLFDPNRWLDLGGLDIIPAEEYFGSALWQLYKGIDSPYKAVLKLILMEAYSADYPNTQLLAVEAKARFQATPTYDHRVDSYYMMLERVTDYLTRIKDVKRLDLIRRCFYLKNSDRYSLPAMLGSQDWPRKVVRELVTKWQWNEEKLAHLNSRHLWKVVEVRAAYSELLDALMLSYRNLIHFARRNRIGESINAEDIGILSRKLYAAFESLPGKVTQINPQISPDLTELELSLIHVEHSPVNASGWYLYRQPLGKEMLGQKALEYSPYVGKLIAWCYFNQLMSAETELYLHTKSSGMKRKKLREFSNDLRHAFPVRVPKASNLALTQPCEIRHLGVFLNLEADTTARWVGRVIEFDTIQNDVLSFGRDRECLISSIDLVYRNSWNEVRTLHFIGKSAVVDAITTILGKMHRDANAPEHIDVFCYASHLRSMVLGRFKTLLLESIEQRLHPERGPSVKTLVIGKTKYGFFFEDRGVTVKKLEKSIDVYSAISNQKLERMPLRLSTGKTQAIPSIVNAQASEGLVQYFFENLSEGLNIYIVDETNRVEVYQQFEGCKDELVQGINRFYTSSKESFDEGPCAINFNLPQFYDIVEEQGQFHVEPYRGVIHGSSNPSEHKRQA
jgi:adenylate cyclase class 1